MVWRRLVLRWPSICWTNVRGGVAASVAAMMSVSVAQFVFNMHKVGVLVPFTHALHNLPVARLL
jgi:hypothetical protein